MYKLTKAQHGILRASAHNFCVSANDKDLSGHHYSLYLLADQVAILTGELPSEQICQKASEKAKELTCKSFDDCMENADKVLAVFIGPFTVEE